MKIDPTCFRPTEVDLLVGDAGEVCEVLGWAPKRQPSRQARLAGEVASRLKRACAAYQADAPVRAQV
jgi:GDP-D-mannose dehydratase